MLPPEEILNTILSGVFAGGICVVAPDHIAPVISLSLTNVDSLRSAIRVGWHWGVGHSSGVLVILTAVWCLRVSASVELFNSIMFYTQICVGCFLVYLGVYYYVNKEHYLSKDGGCDCCAFEAPQPKELAEEDIVCPEIQPTSREAPEIESTSASSASSNVNSDTESSESCSRRGLVSAGGGFSASSTSPARTFRASFKFDSVKLEKPPREHEESPDRPGERPGHHQTGRHGMNENGHLGGGGTSAFRSKFAFGAFSARKSLPFGIDISSPTPSFPSNHLGIGDAEPSWELYATTAEGMQSGMAGRTSSKHASGKSSSRTWGSFWSRNCLNVAFCNPTSATRETGVWVKVRKFFVKTGKGDEVSSSRMVVLLGFLQGFSCPSNLMSIVFIASKLNWIAELIYVFSYSLSSCILMSFFCYCAKKFLISGQIGCRLSELKSAATTELLGSGVSSGSPRRLETDGLLTESRTTSARSSPRIAEGLLDSSNFRQKSDFKSDFKSSIDFTKKIRKRRFSYDYVETDETHDRKRRLYVISCCSLLLSGGTMVLEKFVDIPIFEALHRHSHRIGEDGHLHGEDRHSHDHIHLQDGQLLDGNVYLGFGKSENAYLRGGNNENSINYLSKISTTPSKNLRDEGSHRDETQENAKASNNLTNKENSSDKQGDFKLLISDIPSPGSLQADIDVVQTPITYASERRLKEAGLSKIDTVSNNAGHDPGYRPAKRTGHHGSSAEEGIWDGMGNRRAPDRDGSSGSPNVRNNDADSEIDARGDPEFVSNARQFVLSREHQQVESAKRIVRGRAIERQKHAEDAFILHRREAMNRTPETASYLRPLDGRRKTKKAPLKNLSLGNTGPEQQQQQQQESASMEEDVISP